MSYVVVVEVRVKFRHSDEYVWLPIGYHSNYRSAVNELRELCRMNPGKRYGVVKEPRFYSGVCYNVLKVKERVDGEDSFTDVQPD